MAANECSVAAESSRLGALRTWQAKAADPTTRGLDQSTRRGDLTGGRSVIYNLKCPIRVGGFRRQQRRADLGEAGCQVNTVLVQPAELSSVCLSPPIQDGMIKLSYRPRHPHWIPLCLHNNHTTNDRSVTPSLPKSRFSDWGCRDITPSMSRACLSQYGTKIPIKWLFCVI